MAVNFLAPINLTKKSLELLQQSDQPSVAFITSGLAYTPDADHPSYSASKAALHSFVQSLRHQLRKSNIRVVEVLPPTVDTAFTHHLSSSKIPPQQVAREFVRGLKRGKDTIRVGQAKALSLISRITPTGAFRMLNSDNG